jgi:hypothetical protein
MKKDDDPRGRRRQSDGESDDEEDKKPPARVVHVVLSPPEDSSSENNNNNNNHRSESGETSLASSASLTPPVITNHHPPHTTTTGKVSFKTPPPSVALATPGTFSARKKKEPASRWTTSPLKRRRRRRRALTPHERNRRRLHYSIMAFVAAALTTILVAAYYVWIVLPWALQLTLTLLAVTMQLSLQFLSQVGHDWYQDTILQGRGLGQYLPSGLQHLLTEETLHEWMTDPSFGLEYRHLLVYFLPLAPDQRDAYIANFAPRHREALRRPGGWGYVLFGNQGMRLLLGRERWEQQNQQQQQRPAAQLPSATPAATEVTPSVLPPPSSSQRPRRLLLLDDDSASSSLGLDVSPDDMAGGIESESQAATVAQRLGLGSTTTPEDAPSSTNVPSPQGDEVEEALQNSYYDQEGQVLMDAFWSALYDSVWTPISDYVMTSTVQPVVRRFRLSSSAVLGVSGFGLVLWRFWRPRQHWRSHRTDWTLTAALAGGGMLVSAVGLALWARPMIQQQNAGEKNQPPKKDGSSEEKDK